MAAVIPGQYPFAVTEQHSTAQAQAVPAQLTMEATIAGSSSDLPPLRRVCDADDDVALAEPMPEEPNYIERSLFALNCWKCFCLCFVPKICNVPSCPWDWFCCPCFCLWKVLCSLKRRCQVLTDRCCCKCWLTLPKCIFTCPNLKCLQCCRIRCRSRCCSALINLKCLQCCRIRCRSRCCSALIYELITCCKLSCTWPKCAFSCCKLSCKWPKCTCSCPSCLQRCRPQCCKLKCCNPSCCALKFCMPECCGQCCHLACCSSWCDCEQGCTCIFPSTHCGCGFACPLCPKPCAVCCAASQPCAWLMNGVEQAYWEFRTQGTLIACLLSYLMAPFKILMKIIILIFRPIYKCLVKILRPVLKVIKARCKELAALLRVLVKPLLIVMNIILWPLRIAVSLLLEVAGIILAPFKSVLKPVVCLITRLLKPVKKVFKVVSTPCRLIAKPLKLDKAAKVVSMPCHLIVKLVNFILKSKVSPKGDRSTKPSDQSASRASLKAESPATGTLLHHMVAATEELSGQPLAEAGLKLPMGSKCSATEAKEDAALELERIDDVHGDDGLVACVLRAGDSVADDVDVVNVYSLAH